MYRNDDYPKNNDPFAPWNDPMFKNDPFAPHNDPMYQKDPFACWNDPFGHGSFEQEARDYYGYAW